MRKSFKLENLDCANCAAKMEAGINELPGVNKATISFMTSKLIIDADAANADELTPILDAAQAVCTSYEKDCRIIR
ncbi:cation transporter [uncultured Adlercreutzia sp.]|uniref:cation transporter n=1 Tax=uncultured Adlercreutzia sp. TaxID=875803 RepID=UPI0025EECE3B|nr:cation transporter [uncultured Adlercreutzia sp.]